MRLKLVVICMTVWLRRDSTYQKHGFGYAEVLFLCRLGSIAVVYGRRHLGERLLLPFPDVQVSRRAKTWPPPVAICWNCSFYFRTESVCCCPLPNIECSSIVVVQTAPTENKTLSRQGVRDQEKTKALYFKEKSQVFFFKLKFASMSNSNISFQH